VSGPDREARRARAWAEVLARNPAADAFLVTSLANVRYLCGFTGSSGALLLSSAEPVLGTDGRYLVQAGQECPGVELLIDRQAARALGGRWHAGRGGGPGRLGHRRLPERPAHVEPKRGLRLQAQPSWPLQASLAGRPGEHQAGVACRQGAAPALPLLVEIGLHLKPFAPAVDQ